MFCLTYGIQCYWGGNKKVHPNSYFKIVLLPAASKDAPHHHHQSLALKVAWTCIPTLTQTLFLSHLTWPTTGVVWHPPLSSPITQAPNNFGCHHSTSNAICLQKFMLAHKISSKFTSQECNTQSHHLSASGVITTVKFSTRFANTTLSVRALNNLQQHWREHYSTEVVNMGIVLSTA